MQHMKIFKIIICLIFFIHSINLYPQKPEPELRIITGIDSFKCLIIEDACGVDTIHKYAMNVILLDYYFNDLNNVTIIIETPLAYLLLNYVKFSENDWNAVTKKSGQIAPNYKLLSYREPKFINHQPVSDSFKFLDSRNIQYQEVNGEIRILNVNQIVNRKRY